MSDWHPEDIKAAVRKCGATLARLADAHRISRGALARGLTVPRAHAERAIADFLGLHPMKIWPSRYEPTGERKRPQPRENYTAKPRFDNRVLEQAA